MKPFLADLHIHSGLSPCAADEMTPPAIVQAALEAGLEMIAICDHNAATNTAATQAAGAKAGLAVLAAMEVTTAEEVHVVGFFPAAPDANAAADAVRATLPNADDTYYQRFGVQQEMDADGRVLGMEPRMLASASGLDLSATVDLIHRHGGLAVAAHVNRPSFSVLSQLGLFPLDVAFDAIEVFTPCGPGGARGSNTAAIEKLAALGKPILASSDAHFLGDIGRCRTTLTLESPTFDEFRLALTGAGGRGVRRA